MSELDVTNRLKDMNSAYQEAEAPEGGSYELPPDGDYQAVVERFDWFEAKSGEGHLFLKTEMRVANGPHSGASVDTVHDVEDPERLGWLKRHLTTLGVKDGPLSTLEKRLADVVGVPVEVRVKTSTKTNADGIPYRNVYANKRLGDPGATPTPAGKNPDDKIPF
jgi:hypothetical protein